MPEFNWYLEVIKVGGPPVIILLATAVVLLYRELKARDKAIATLHKEKEEMYNQWRKESSERNQRLMDALHNSTIAISDHSANAESMKVGLQGIMTFMAGYVERRRG